MIQDALKKTNDEISSKKKIKRSQKRNRIKFWLIIIKYWFLSLFSNPIYANGVHLFDAPSGTGKTLLANYVLQTSTKRNGFWYTNIDEFDSTKQVVFDVNKLFASGKQVAKLPFKILDQDKYPKYAEGIIFDELNLNFNRRMNRTTEYNSLFVGLMEMVVSHRHQHMNRLYFLSQDLSFNDGQIQQAFKYHHLIYAKKRYNYDLYLLDGKVVKTPKKLLVEHWIKTGQKDARGMPVFAHFKTSKIKINTKKHILTYNHLGYAKKYESLPDYQI